MRAVLRVAFESKYIKITISLVIVLIAVFFVMGNSLEINLQKEASKEKIFGEKGEYLIVGKDHQITVQTKDGEVVYTAIGSSPYFAEKEGYIVDKTPIGKVGVVNFLTGETVFVPEGDDTIFANKAGFWIIETIVRRDEVAGTYAWYVLDENFELAMDGRMFTAVDGTDKYIYGQMLVNENYYNKENLANYETFGPHAEIKNCVIDRSGEIVYTSDKHIYSMDGDRVKVDSERSGRYKYVDIYTGETEDAGYDSD